MVSPFQDSYEERPAPIIHRNFDECMNSPISNTLSMVQNFHIPLTSLPGMVSDGEATEVSEEEFKTDQPVFPGQPVDTPGTTKPHKVTDVEIIRQINQQTSILFYFYI